MRAASRICDADGNEYIDFDMAFGVLAAGHSHPILAEVLAAPRRERHLLHVPGRGRHRAGRGDQARFGGDLVRFSNSGTEATMDAIRVARGYTGREKIVKFEGGYHGHHDDVLVSIQPPRELMGPTMRRPPCPPAPACRARRIAETVVAPFNEPDAARGDPRGATAARSRRSSSSRCSSTSASCRHFPATWSASASWPRSTASVLIFDEVKTGVVLAYGGASEYFGVKPDLFCLAKSIGGGMPIGAFGGRAEVMARHRDARGQTPPTGAPASSALDDPGRRDARRPPGHVQRQSAVDDRRASSR